jgi:hypothetical protein
LKQLTPEREKSMPTIHSSGDKPIGDTSTIKEEEEGEVNGNGNGTATPPVSAGAVVINVLSSPGSQVSRS